MSISGELSGKGLSIRWGGRMEIWDGNFWRKEGCD